MTHNKTSHLSTTKAQATGLSRSIWANPRTSSRSHFYRSWARSAPTSESRVQSSSDPPLRARVRGTTAAKASAASSSRALTPTHALHRFEQICHRLRWKRIDLEHAYDRALNSEKWGFTTMDAERNFKVDFHEFYAWVEQAVVLILVVFDIPIASTRTSGSSSNHAYHQDVLRTVEEDGGPLGEALGRGQVVQAFWKAKELRNRWKGAHVEGGEIGPPLGMYHLAWIVKEILGGLEVVYELAKEKVEQVAKEDNSADAVEAQEDWQWMVEMDWEEN